MVPTGPAIVRRVNALQGLTVIIIGSRQYLGAILRVCGDGGFVHSIPALGDLQVGENTWGGATRKCLL